MKRTAPPIEGPVYRFRSSNHIDIINQPRPGGALFGDPLDTRGNLKDG
jgi:hypothetical protein